MSTNMAPVTPSRMPEPTASAPPAMARRFDGFDR